MATAIDSGIGILNYGRQVAKGTKATAATTTVGYNRPKWQDGLLKTGKKLGKKEYIDGNRFASPSEYTDMVAGVVGDLTVQLQPENVGLFSAAILGVDVVTGASDPYTHTSSSAGTSGQWGTWWQKVGSAVGPQRETYWDSKIAKAVMRHNFADKLLVGELSIQALKIEAHTVDPAKTEDASDPYLHTEATGSITFDGTVNSEVNEVIVDVDTGMEPYYGDNIFPVQLIEKKGLITISMKSIITDEGLQKYRKAIWNNIAPAAGDAPVKDVFYAAFTETLTRSATRTCTISAPKIAVNPEAMAVAAQGEGGPVELPLGGECLKSGATPALTTVTLSGDATTYA